jgi:hypothetical protein
MWELSTPFMHARWFLYKIGRDKTPLYPANALLGMLIFFLCRNCFGPWLSYAFLKQSAAALQTARGRRELWMPAIWFFRSAVVILNGLNAFWFSKMFKMLLEAVNGAGGKAEAGRAKKGGGGDGKPAAAAAMGGKGGAGTVRVTASAAATPPRRGSSRMLAGQA